MAYVKGGKHIFGFKIGILMLDSRFPRVPGDMGNACSFDFPVLYKVVKGKTPGKVVTDLQDSDLEAFIEAAKELEAEGVGAITTNCGFLGMFHEKIAAALKIPFFSSSLMMIPFVSRMLPPDQIVGVMTVNKETLTDRHLAGAGALETPKVIYGLQTEEEFTNSILEDRLEMDIEKCRQEHIRVAEKMIEEHPEVGAIVLECTNMPPYAEDIQKATGRPVFDIRSLMWFVQTALARPEVKGWM